MQQNESMARRIGRRLRELGKKGFQRDNLIVIVLVGILLFIIALPTKKAGQAEIQWQGGSSLMGQGAEQAAGIGQKEPATGGSPGQSAEEAAGQKEQSGGNVQGKEVTDYGQMGESNYERMQEEKLKALLSAMDGVGEVEVMLTFASSEEQVVEKDEPVTRGNTVEKDSEGGSRTVTQYEKGDTTVYETERGEPFVIKTLYPRVEGVLVVAQGAGDGMVDRSITEAVQALFGVEAHRVKVLPMGGGE